MLRRLLLPALGTLLLVGGVAPVSAAPRLSSAHAHKPHITVSAEGSGSLIAVTYRSRHGQRVRFLHSQEPVERLAVTDVDNDGDLDILVAPRTGAVRLWRNRGHGRFALATLPGHAHRLAGRGSRFVRFRKPDDGWQWYDDRYDAAMPRAPAVAAAMPVAVVRASSSASLHPVPVRRSSGRAPPLA